MPDYDTSSAGPTPVPVIALDGGSTREATTRWAAQQLRAVAAIDGLELVAGGAEGTPWLTVACHSGFSDDPTARYQPASRAPELLDQLARARQLQLAGLAGPESHAQLLAELWAGTRDAVEGQLACLVAEPAAAREFLLHDALCRFASLLAGADSLHGAEWKRMLAGWAELVIVRFEGRHPWSLAPIANAAHRARRRLGSHRSRLRDAARARLQDGSLHRVERAALRRLVSEPVLRRLSAATALAEPPPSIEDPVLVHRGSGARCWAVSTAASIGAFVRLAVGGGLPAEEDKHEP